jgi:cytochrome c oxidase subunit IV
MTPHILSRQVYFRVFAALLILTAVTVGVAFVDLGPLNTIIALTIAISKALLVILFFMHVRYSPPLIWIYVAAGVIWLAYLLLFTLTDYTTRGWLTVTGW